MNSYIKFAPDIDSILWHLDALRFGQHKRRTRHDYRVITSVTLIALVVILFVAGHFGGFAKSLEPIWPPLGIVIPIIIVLLFQTSSTSSARTDTDGK